MNVAASNPHAYVPSKRDAAEATQANETVAKAAAEGANITHSAPEHVELGSQNEKFGEVWKKIQAEYGGKAEKPREIKKTLGKDDFLKIMVTQMKNQDPTKPFNADQMAQQMAQYASVEQLQNINQGMNKLQTQNQPLERLAMTNLIGKSITVDKDRFPHSEGSKSALTYELPSDAAHVRLSIVNETGEVILTKDLGEQPKGKQSFVWDGAKSNTMPAKSGSYVYRLEAADKNGVKIQVGSRSQSKVVGVSFEGKEPIVLVGDPRRPEKVAMSNIVRIESEGGSMDPEATPAPMAAPAAVSASPAHDHAVELHHQRLGGVPNQAGSMPGAHHPQMSEQAVGSGPAIAAQAAPSPVKPEQNNNMFSFTKGGGSETIDPSKLNPEVQRAIAAFQQQAQPLEGGEMR